jgi:hypothetical protein
MPAFTGSEAKLWREVRLPPVAKHDLFSPIQAESDELEKAGAYVCFSLISGPLVC